MKNTLFTIMWGEINPGETKGATVLSHQRPVGIWKSDAVYQVGLEEHYILRAPFAKLKCWIHRSTVTKLVLLKSEVDEKSPELDIWKDLIFI